MTNKLKVNKTIETVEEIARKIWLAGLGAYGKSFEEIQSQYQKINSETTRFFEELVSKGEKLDAKTDHHLKEKTTAQKRVEEVRRKLGLDRPNTSTSTSTKLGELSQKVDALTEAVSKIS